MKKIFLLLAAVALIGTVRAQSGERFTFSTTVGTGVALSAPKCAPFEWQVLGHYSLSPRFSVGIGTGLSFYEETLIPLFADVKFTILKPRKFTPYLECGAGYGFAPGRDANGGIFLNPSAGVQYRVCGNKKVFLSLGYERQKLERLKKYESSLFSAEFAEKPDHRAISVRAGFIF